MSAENGASAKLHVEYPRTEENGFYVFSNMGSVSYERPLALEYNWGILDEEEKQMATALVEGGKADLFASWGPPGINDQAKRQFFKFIKEQRKKYEGLPVTAFLDTQARNDEVMRLCLASNAPVPNLLAFCERTEDSKKKKNGGRNDYKIVTMKVPFKFSGTTEEVADKASAAFYGGPKALEVEGSALRSKILKQYSRDPSEGTRWMWHPYRCEQSECERTDRLQKCGGCQAVYYCCAEHQNEDWARHKVDCKALKSLKVRVLPYRVEEELPQHPINCFQWHILRTAEEASFPCEICHRSPFGFSRRFVRAECCGATLCVPKDSKAAHDPTKACNAFHRLSTCYYHWEQRHPGQDWRLCRLCREPRDKEKKKAPFLNNGWEVTPMIDVTKGRLYTDPCATKGCKNRVFVGDPEIKCQDCLKKA